MADGGWVWLEYPAHGATLDLLGDPRGFFESVAQGTDRLVANLRDEATRCENQMILLAGYSQGAWVIHNALDEIAGEDAVANRIGGVALVADARRSNPDPVNRGGAGQSTGVAAAIPFAGLQRAVPARFTPVTTSLCVDNDPVCDFTPANLRFASRHESYETNGLASDVASSWLVRRAKTIPSSTSRDLGDHPWGESIRITIDRLGATGTQRFTADPGTPLPGGLTLSPGGTIAGRAHVEGDYHFQVIATGPHGDRRSLPLRLGIVSSTFEVSTAADGTPANGVTFGPAFLPGGRLFMNSLATSLVPEDTSDTPGTLDMFVKDLDSGIVTRYPTPEGLVLDFGLPAPGGSALIGNFHTDDENQTADIGFIDAATGAYTEGYRGDGAYSPLWLGDGSGAVFSTADDITGDGQLITQPDSIPAVQLYLLRPDGSRLLLRPKVGNRPLAVGPVWDTAGTRVLFSGARVLANGTLDEASSGVYDYDVATGQLRRFDLDAAGNSLLFRFNAGTYTSNGNRLLIEDPTCPSGVMSKAPGRTDPVPVGPCDGVPLPITEQLGTTTYAVQRTGGSGVYDSRTGTVRNLATDEYGTTPRCADCRYFISGYYGPITYDGFVAFAELDLIGRSQRILMRRYLPPS